MDEAAWEGFARQYGPMLVTFIQCRFSCGRERAEEVVQMTFVRCVRSIGTFKPARGKLSAWLKTVARNEAVTLFRSEGRMQVDSPSAPDAQRAGLRWLDQIDTAPLPDELLARQDVQLLVQEALLELNARYRTALTMKYLRGHTVAEIARHMEATEKAVESLLTRARSALRQVMLTKEQEGVRS